PRVSPAHAASIKNPIDNFVIARLEKEGLSPSPEAAKETLLRRVTLDLTGLPPTPAEIDAFVKDTSPNAYERVVDRLLESPRYGERMASRWLDAARYADSNGYQYDGERTMWPWRDWVVRAFNQNKPFDQFTVEQLAGDLLPNATSDQRIATGFNRNHRINTEDGIIAEEYEVEDVADRVETTSTVFLGLTLGCARCHNHKYDPFTQKEFYQFFAYFNNVPESGRGMKYGNSPPVELAPTDSQKQELAALDSRIERISRFMAAHNAEITRSQSVWERTLPKSGASAWSPTEGLKFALKDKFDGTAIDAGDQCGFDIEDRFSISVWVSGDAPEGPMVSRMEDKEEGRGYSVGIKSGHVVVYLTSNWVSDAIRMQSEQTVAPAKWHHIAVTYTGSRMAEGVRIYIDGALATAKVEQDNLYRPFRNAGKAVKDPLRIGGGWGPKDPFKGLLDRVRVYDRVLPGDEIAGLAIGAPIESLAHKEAAQRRDSESYVLRRYFLENAAPEEIKTQWDSKLGLEQQREELVRAFPTVMVMAERPQRNATFILNRGAYDAPGDKVEPGVPAVLPPLPPNAPPNRLGFAEWLVSKDNPLLARVTVNRFWQMYFGTGIVKTTEDFGRQGEWPSHPELLDWLAVRFRASGWDVMALQKLIVMSATYQQSSRITPELLTRDPENKLLARGPRVRLEAELIRDSLLKVGGLLSPKRGGPSVFPPQPVSVTTEGVYGPIQWKPSTGEDRYRRGMYTFLKRSIPYAMFSTFDGVTGETCLARREVSNTPLQALTMLNDLVVIEAAQKLGSTLASAPGPIEERMTDL
ncbi:MAG TPA: DUF1549 domain-containing protein, partial [Candidatus Binataceae bacterium]|nr:DUF1549 domain-containing protein [Candidatus Binataceae bacterium]